MLAQWCSVSSMTFNEPEEIGEDLPIPDKQGRRLPIGWIALAIGAVALIALLALSY